MSKGWFADVDDDETLPREFRWQPVLDTNEGSCHSFDVWFRTEAECEEYISRCIIGAPLLRNPEPFVLPTVAGEGEEACPAWDNGHRCQLPIWHKQLQHYERTGDNITTWLDDAMISALQGPPDDRLWIGP